MFQELSPSGAQNKHLGTPDVTNQILFFFFRFDNDALTLIFEHHSFH